MSAGSLSGQPGAGCCCCENRDRCRRASGRARSATSCYRRGRRFAAAIAALAAACVLAGAGSAPESEDGSPPQRPGVVRAVEVRHGSADCAAHAATDRRDATELARAACASSARARFVGRGSPRAPPRRGTNRPGEGPFRGRWCAQLRPLSCDHRLIQKFIVTIEGPGWKDLQEIELTRLPDEGEPIETKYGVCLVTHVERTPGRYDGKIVCRFSEE